MVGKSPEEEYQQTLKLRHSDYEVSEDTQACCMAKVLMYLVEKGLWAVER